MPWSDSSSPEPIPDSSLSPTPESKAAYPSWITLRIGEVIIAAGIIVCMVLLNYAESMYAGQGVWLSWESDPGYFCERDRPLHLLREPQNAWSSFAFLTAGLWVWLCAYWYVIVGVSVSSFPFLTAIILNVRLTHSFNF